MNRTLEDFSKINPDDYLISNEDSSYTIALTKLLEENRELLYKHLEVYADWERRFTEAINQFKVEAGS